MNDFARAISVGDVDIRTIPESDVDRVSRAQRAANLLAALSSESSQQLGISVDDIAAVAHLVQSELQVAIANMR